MSPLCPFSPNKSLILAALPVLYALYHLLKAPVRPRKVSKVGERVLVLGASSGIGRAVARQYAERGARVCVVGRRKALVEEAAQECRDTGAGAAAAIVVDFEGDFTDVEDMVRIREVLSTQWGGLDTLVVAAGVSALQPLLAVAGAAGRGSELKAAQTTTTTVEGIGRAKDVALAATNGNYVGPLVAAVTFIPLLSATSPAPAILLVSSLASVIPAPTRTIYASTKAASLVLYQALSIEHPQIAFSCIMPSTVEGDFRASAVDAGPVREQDPNKHGLKREYVAKECVAAVDRGTRTVFLPRSMRVAHLLYWIWPSVVERLACRKYNYTP